MIQPLDTFCVRTRGIGGGVVRIGLSSRRKKRIVITNHNASVWSDDDGQLYVTQIEPRRNKIYTLEEYLQLLEREKAEWFACRVAILEHIAEYDPTIVDTLQPAAARFWKSLDGQKYPLRDCWVIYRNIVLQPLKRLHLIKPDLAHVYCTEGTRDGLLEIRMRLPCLTGVGMVHPGHIENGCRSGELVFAAGDRALWNRVMAANQNLNIGKVPMADREEPKKEIANEMD